MSSKKASGGKTRSRPWRRTKEEVAEERRRSREILGRETKGKGVTVYGHRGGVDAKLLDVCMKVQLAKDEDVEGKIFPASFQTEVIDRTRSKLRVETVDLLRRGPSFV